MPAQSIVAFYWGNRQSLASESASLLLPAFDVLREEGFDRFFRKGRTRKTAASAPFVPSLDSLTALLTQGVNRRDVGRQPIPELGQRLGLWSGGTDSEAYSLSILVGSTASAGRNSFILQLPDRGPYCLSSAMERVRLLVQRLIPILHPDQAIVCEAGAIRWQDGKLAQDIPCALRYDSAA